MSGPCFLVIAFPSVGRAGLEPARFLLIRQAPSPSWPPPRSERGHRTPDLPSYESGALPAELSRHGWPPGSRTQQLPAYQTVPFTGWVAASGWRRSRTPGRAPARVQAGCRAAARASRAESARVEPAGLKLICFRGRSRRLTGSLSMAEGRRTCAGQNFRRHPVSSRGPHLSVHPSMEERAGLERRAPGVALAASAAPWPIAHERWAGQANRPVRADRCGVISPPRSVPLPGFEPRTSRV